VTETATETVAASSTATSGTAAATAPPTVQQPPTQEAQPALRPGPRSALADIFLPAGTIACATISCGEDDLSSAADTSSEIWRYNAPREELVSFLQKQFANGPVYDGYGATSWMGLPPCYGTDRQSPPLGERTVSGTTWKWSGRSSSLGVIVNEVGAPNGVGGVIDRPIIIIIRNNSPLDECLRG
jgi:hypothetical protein